MVWGRILTEDGLKIKGWLLAGYCCMSNDVEELVDYLLIHCGKVRGLWHFLFSLFSISWVLPHLVKGMLMCWNLTCGQEDENNMENNSSIPFLDNPEGKQCINQYLKDYLISDLYTWSWGYLIVDGQTNPPSLIDFIINLLISKY